MNPLAFHGRSRGNTPLDGLTALVTGGSRGIGRAAVRALAELGCSVVAMSRSAADLELVVAMSASEGAEVIAVVCDVTDDVQVKCALDRIGVIDILVNAAGTNVPQPFPEVSADTFDQLFKLNLRSTFIVTQHAVKRMLADGRAGSIVNVSSQMGHVGASNRSVYCATKHAIEGLTKALAVELGPAGIRVNTVAPTFIETSMTAPFLANDEFRSSVVSQIPLGRIGTVDEVAAAIAFLASPSSSLVTGTSLLVDGGWTAH